MVRLGLGELADPAAWRAAAAEGVGTGLFVFLGAGAVVASGLLTGNELTAARLLVIAMAHGLAIMLLVAATASISGGHINPAVSIGVWAAGRAGAGRTALYVAAQLAGGIAGALLLKAVVPAGVEGSLGAHALGDLVGGPGAAVVMEGVLTFALVFVVFATAVDSRGLGSYAPAAIGMAVLVDHLVGVPATGASMNPARSLGPAVAAGAWADHWVYWAGPIAGAVVAALLYRYLFMRGREG